MTEVLLISGIVLICCILVNNVAGKTGTPALLLFMAIGMIFGSDGLFKIPFDNYDIMQQVSTIALVFIIFYGGFSTKWKTAKPVIKQATVLSTLGVLFTALLTCAFCYYCLHIPFEESFVIGAVISSTDAASVFAILRSKKLNLKNSTAPLLELESGSNDPFSYMLTIIGIALLTGKSVSFIPVLFTKQIIFGIFTGIFIAFSANWILKKTNIVTENIYSIFMTAIIIFSFALPDLIGGNGLLSVYIAGIILGNSNIKSTKSLVGFFDGITSLAQISIFFLLGLTSFPHRMPEILIPGTLIALFLTFVARPVVVFGLLLPFKASINQCLLVSWAGLRGAASIVFAVLVVASVNTIPKYDLFHIVFLISLLSVAFQGTLLPFAAKITNMIDENSDVRKTFNDYQEEMSISLMKIYITDSHAWNGKSIKELALPHDTLVLMLKRAGKEIVAKGDTIIHSGDYVILSMPSYNAEDDTDLRELHINGKHEWCDKQISELKLQKDELIAMIKRNGKTIVPKGSTKIKNDDVLVILKQEF